MPAHSLHETTALTNYVQVCDQDGHLLLVPSVWIEQLATAGVEQIVATIRVPGATAPLITLAEAVRRHVEADCDPPVDAEDVRRISAAARMRIKRACDSNEIDTVARGGDRLLDRASLDAWRLRYRETQLDQA